MYHRNERNYFLQLITFLAVIFTAAIASATLNATVTVSSISCSSGVCTVTTSTAHNIPSNDAGFVLAGGPTADQIASTAASVPTSTTFTFNSNTATTCSSSCGTAQSAPNFIILGNPFTGQLGTQGVIACVWTYTTVPFPQSGKTSACSVAISTSVSTLSSLASEINGALASGAWVENVVQLTVATSDTTAQIEQELQRIQFAAQLQQAGGAQPGRDTGTVCNSGGCNQ